MIEIILALARRYLPQIVGAIAIILALWYLHHTIYESGREDERAVWQEAELKIRKESEAIMAKSVAEYEEELKRQKSNLIGAFNESEKLRNNLKRDIAESGKHRMYVKTKTPPCGGNAVPTKAADSGGVDRARETIQRSELDRETEQNIRRDYSEIADGANACKVMLELVEKNFEAAK